MKDIILKIAGKKFPLEIIRLKIQQQINDIPSAQIELEVPAANDRPQDMPSASNYMPGAKVVILLSDNNQPALFEGYLIQKKMRLCGNTWSMTLEARHTLHQLLSPPRCQLFHQQDDPSIFANLLKSAGGVINLPGSTRASLTTKYPQLIQFRCSDWHFLLSRLFANNCWLLPDAGSNKVIIRSLTETNSKRPVQQLYRHGSSSSSSSSKRDDIIIYEVNITFDNRFTLDQVLLQGWNAREQQLSASPKISNTAFHPWQAKTSNAPAVEKSDITGSPHLLPRNWQQTFSHLPEASLDKLAQSWFNHRQLTAVQGRIVINGSTDFACGDQVQLKEFGDGMDGTAILTGINHQFDPSYGWRSELIFGLPNNPTEMVPSIQSLHIATVAQFSDDPKKLDSIPIHLPALDKAGVIYARQSKPYASKNSGFCFYPEPGDEVVVGFLECDPCYPVILGALHNPKNKAPFPPDKENNRKALLFNHENNITQLVFDTQKNSLTFAALDHTFSLNQDNNITFSTPDSLKFSAKSITQQATTTFSLSGKNKVEIQGNSINLKK